jgi:SAM-dependent methyltransferase
MRSLLIPRRRRGFEILDSPDVDPQVVTRSLSDVVKANALFGGVSSVMDELADRSICGDARHLPVADNSIDIVMCSQVLHHFNDDEALMVLREMNRVARSRVIVCDLRRSWISAAGLWLVSFPLRFHAVSRHDGVVSVLRGYTSGELADTVQSAVKRRPVAHRRRGFRVTTSWAPVHQ